MPRNPDKRRCQVPGCKAWAKHGYDLCASHLHSRTIGGDAHRVLPLLRLTAGQGGEADAPAVSDDDLTVIDDELRQLLAARSLFMGWLQSLREEEDPERPAVTPTQFLRAWNDSTTRVVQLLRARAALRGEAGGSFGALMESVYDELDSLLQAAEAQEPAANAGEVANGDHHG